MAQLSQRQYALHRKALGLPGGSLRAVQKALEAGRITCLDPDIADREWAESTTRSAPPATMQTSAPAQAPELRLVPPKEPTAAQMLVEEKAAREKIKRQRESGEVISREEVRQDVLELISALVGRLLLIPDKLAPRVAATSDVAECRSVLDYELRHALDELSRYEVAA
jgi:hypothetical protein